MFIPRFIRRWFRPPYDGLRNFRVVVPGELYRCGQPSPAQLAELIREHGLRTVVSLRGRRDSDHADAWEDEERAVCDANGAAFVSIPFNHKTPPTAEQVREFLELMRDARRRPALVHCRIGQQRTGLFCALYRVLIQRVPPEDALREMDELGFNSRHRRHQQLLRSFHELSGALART